MGFNLFDRDFITVRMAVYKIDKLENSFTFFKRIYQRDLYYCLYTLNNFSFKDLSAENLANKFSINKSIYSNKENSHFYRSKQFSKIEKHFI